MHIMREVFYDMPSDFWHDGWLGKFIAFIWLGLIMLIMSIVTYITYIMIDSAFLTYHNTQAQVMSKYINKAHDESSYITYSSGKTTMIIPQIVHYDDRYYLQLEVKGMYGTMQVTEKQYNDLSKNTIVNVNYAKNRLSNSISFQ